MAVESTAGFQFTPLREGRLRLRCAIGVHHSISIHAPPRGATRHSSSPPLHGYHFNSRPSARGDDQELQDQITAHTFQFTPLREGRHVTKDNVIGVICISIHAPPRGATRYGKAGMHRAPFQFTPLREGRHFPTCGKLKRNLNFNSRPSARGDYCFICT